MARQKRTRPSAGGSSPQLSVEERTRLEDVARATAAVDDWAAALIRGTIPSGDLMRMAAERHIRDKRDGRWHWDAAAAGQALHFFPSMLSVTAGTMEGKPFNLPGYLGFVIGSLFGWKNDDGRLRFRECWLELGKGMVKTPLSAAVGIYLMGWAGIRRAEIYAIAKDRTQANVLFADAVALCRAPIPMTPQYSLESSGQIVIRGTGNMSWMIEHPNTGSMFRALANDERISGPRPTMVCGDEIHEWPSMAQIELWKAALVKMPGVALLMLTTNTPAADQVAATEVSDYYQGVLRGNFKDDAALALIARVDDKDQPMDDESCWPKALPLLGVTYPIENVRTAVEQSRHRISTQMATKRLYFGIPVGASSWWIDLDAWEAVQGEFDEEDMVGLDCYLSLDLSQKNDLTAVGKLWTHLDGKDRLGISYWRPRIGVVEAATRDGAQYVEWAEEGYLNLTPGRTIEYEFVAAEIQRIYAVHNVVALAFDPAHAIEFRQACDRIGFKTWIWRPDEPPGEGLKMIVHQQGRAGMNSKHSLWMPRSLQQLEDAILANEIVVQRSPLTNWCSANATVQTDAQNNKWLIKKRQRGRIDGLIAAAMARGLGELRGEMGPQKYQRKPEFQIFTM